MGSFPGGELFHNVFLLKTIPKQQRVQLLRIGISINAVALTHSFFEARFYITKNFRYLKWRVSRSPYFRLFWWWGNSRIHKPENIQLKKHGEDSSRSFGRRSHDGFDDWDDVHSKNLGNWVVFESVSF